MATTPATGPLRLLAVLAHPDDESLGLGGVLAKYAAQGVETAVITATLGQAGRFRGVKEGEGEHPGREELARIREQELRAAAEVLGVKHLTLLGYVDGALDQVDPLEIVRRIEAEIRRFRPQVIVTFGPEGGYGHPDHIAISQFALAASLAAANHHDGPPSGPHVVSKFYYMASSEEAWRAYQWAFKTLTSTVDGEERGARPWPEWAITTSVDTRDVWPTVWKAVSCHQSQVASYQRLRELSPEHHEALWGHQTFYRVFSLVNGGRRRETDLFEGLRP